MTSFQEAINSMIDKFETLIADHGEDGARPKILRHLNILQRMNLREQLSFDGLNLRDHIAVHAEVSKYVDSVYGSNKGQFLMRMSRDVRCKLDFLSDELGIPKSQVVEMLIKRTNVDFFGGRNVG